MSKRDLIKDIIIGMSDGLTVPFALTAGLSGVIENNTTIVIAGIAEIAAGCIAMGLGGYLAGETEVDQYNNLLKKEHLAIVENPEEEFKHVEESIRAFGVDDDLCKKVATQITSNKEHWADFMMQVELKVEKPHPERAGKSAVTIGLSYLIGGLVPLLPYVFTDTIQNGFKYSCIFTVLALILFGFFKSKMTGQNMLYGTLKVTMIGIVAAAAAYFLAKTIS
jgi:VIT1/CCC1 family predicted Fe2+/Mn2+ transporter